MKSISVNYFFALQKNTAALCPAPTPTGRDAWALTELVEAEKIGSTLNGGGLTETPGAVRGQLGQIKIPDMTMRVLGSSGATLPEACYSECRTLTYGSSATSVGASALSSGR